MSSLDDNTIAHTQGNGTGSNGHEIRVLTFNLCLISPGGNMRRPAHLALLTTAVLVPLMVHWCTLWCHWLISMVVVCATWPWIMPHAAQITALIAMVVWPSFHEQYKKERISLLLAGLAADHYDVIVFQECLNTWFSSAHMQYILQQCHQLGFKHTSLPPWRPKYPATFLNSGLVLLSRLPIEVARYGAYSKTAWYEHTICNRGALYARCVLPDGQRVHVFTTHLSPGSQSFLKALQIDNEKYGLRFVNSIARHQLGQLVSFMQQCIHDSQSSSSAAASASARVAPPIILAGDFNFDGASANYCKLLSLLSSAGVALTDLFCETVDGRSHWPPSFGTIDEAGLPTETLLCHKPDQCRPRTLDYIFSNRTASLRRVLPFAAPRSLPYQQVSDHHALCAVINIEAYHDHQS